MRVWGYNAAVAALLFAIVTPLLLVPMVSFVYRRYGRLATLPFLAVVGAIFYVLVILAATILPLPGTQEEACARINTGWHLTPFRAFTEAVEVAGEVGMPTFLYSWTFLQLLMNVVLLIPLGILIGWRSRRSVWIAAGAGFAVSLAIELTQGSGIFGLYDCPYRYAEFDDLLNNTVGAVIGWAIGTLIARRVPWPRRLGADDTDAWDRPVRIGRRVLAVGLDALGLVLTSLLVQVVALVSARALGLFHVGDELDPTAVLLAGTVVPALVVFVVTPFVRADRASPGQAAVLLTPVRADTTPATRRRVLVRAIIRWWAVLLFLAAPTRETILVLGLWTVTELVTVAVRRDRRSLPDLGSGLSLVGRAPRRRGWTGHRTAADPSRTS